MATARFDYNVYDANLFGDLPNGWITVARFLLIDGEMDFTRSEEQHIDATEYPEALTDEDNWWEDNDYARNRPWFLDLLTWGN